VRGVLEIGRYAGGDEKLWNDKVDLKVRLLRRLKELKKALDDISEL